MEKELSINEIGLLTEGALKLANVAYMRQDRLLAGYALDALLYIPRAYRSNMIDNAIDGMYEIVKEQAK